jgi:hypothetical protein
MRGSAGVSRALVVAAGIGLAQVWALAGGQTKPPATRPAAKPAIRGESPPLQKGEPAKGDLLKGGSVVATRPPGCSKSFVMPDESFRTLDDVRDASLWVDDIDSGLFGGFDTFDVYVVTGKLYAPFQLKQGKLGRDNFRKYTANNYNTVKQGPLAISSARPRGDLAFTQDGRTFTLKVSGVQPSTFDRDTVTVQLCW